MPKPISMVVVDDSALMRLMITRFLEETGNFKILATASDGKEGVEKICSLKPDAVTMDVEMPRQDGLSALREVMRRCPVPVIMLSSLTTEGASATMKALAFGAVDFVPKPSSPAQVKEIAGQLAWKIITAVRYSNVKQFKKSPARANPVKPAPVKLLKPAANRQIDMVVIGSSTGGPAALQSLLPSLPGNFPAAIVVVQHLPRGFSRPMADHLARKCQMEVRHAQHNDPVLPGRILVAPAGFDLDFRPAGNTWSVILDEGLNRPLKPGEFRPSVDLVMSCAARVYGNRALGVLLTGMGRDGARGMALLKQSGAYTIAEAESTCVVYGMPRAAIESGVVDKVLPLPQIAREIIKQV